MRAEAAWTAAQIELLKKLWAEGETAAAISARLGGLSRSAVLGKVFRLRLGAAKTATASSKKAKSVANGGEATAQARRRRGGKRSKRAQPVMPPTVRQHTMLFDLTNKTCRWPHGQPGTNNFFFCGAPEADLEQGIPYCARHMQRAYGTAASGENAELTAWTGLHRFPFRFALAAGRRRRNRGNAVPVK